MLGSVAEVIGDTNGSRVSLDEVQVVSLAGFSIEHEMIHIMSASITFHRCRY